jgi:prevent-host-death family protein
MPDHYNVHQAKTQLSRLLERAERGEEIVIARGGRPVARLVPYRPRQARRRLGRAKGKIWMAADFDATPEDLIRSFEGDEP